MSVEEVVQGTTPIIRVTIVDQDGTAVDVSGAATKTFYLTPQSGAQLTKTASFNTTGTDGVLKYQGLTTDFTTLGVWTVVAHVTWTAGDVFTSLPETFIVRHKRFTPA